MTTIFVPLTAKRRQASEWATGEGVSGNDENPSGWHQLSWRAASGITGNSGLGGRQATSLAEPGSWTVDGGEERLRGVAVPVPCQWSLPLGLRRRDCKPKLGQRQPSRRPQPQLDGWRLPTVYWQTTSDAGSAPVPRCNHCNHLGGNMAFPSRGVVVYVHEARSRSEVCLEVRGQADNIPTGAHMRHNPRSRSREATTTFELRLR
ncbi:hypothetical protein C8Q78DRAFT_799516 [Trametes maxima]|nr:hypothetical protein C8Q78DRAFT_799516 [Trametes maxima]